MAAIALKIPRLTKADFVELCQTNQNLELELTAAGEVIVLSPAFSWTGKQNAGIVAQLWNWNDRTGSGVVFDSSAGFALPNEAIRSPDAAWIANDRWNTLSSTQQQEEFSPIAPDFAIELRPSSDDLKPLQEKMQEYLTNGVRLGWLIDPARRWVEIYRPDRPVEVRQNPLIISEELVLPGFDLHLSKVW